MSTLQELLAQRAELENRIATIQREERAGAIEQIRELMARYSLTEDDLNERTAASRAARPAGNKVAAKYRDPATGNSWSGRGLRPKWLSAAIEAGRTLEEFAV
ncbi:MAG: H-NS histone family protein [Burkholderiales bacterium]|nr:H-NS histone family protein [Burkholderiales bacterium]MDE2397295.1 H-NS histone family protein [Burkholderiales bacterium]MDE2452032.1 H-NS histone family protein [Burkholderiales bacterium]